MRRSLRVAFAGTVAACAAACATLLDLDEGVPRQDAGIAPPRVDASQTDVAVPPADGAVIDAAAQDCGAPPTVAPTPDAGVFCPNQKLADGGSISGRCKLGEHCCTGGDMSYGQCGKSLLSCDVDAGALDFQCQDTADCVLGGGGFGTVCCFEGTFAPEPACGYLVANKPRGSACRKGCATGETQACSGGVFDNCPKPATCQPVRALGIDFGVCAN